MNRLSQFHGDVLLILNIIFVCNKYFKHHSPHDKASLFIFQILAIILNCLTVGASGDDFLLGLCAV